MVKKVKLQALRSEFEMMQMEDEKRISDFFIRIRSITNAMSLNREQLTDQQIYEKVTRSLTPKFDYDVCSIETMEVS